MRGDAGTPWFRPKRYGYGATPQTWQGWAAIALFVVAMVLDLWFLRGAARWAVGGMLIATFIALAYAKSGAPWRWRWGR